MRRHMHGFGGRFKSEADLVTLAQLKSGQSGTVVDILGGHRMLDRLNSLGIIPGKKITKTSAMLMRGPVTVEVDRVEVAIGFGMASKVMVKPD
jgi:ferrous iron transport protein A